MSLARLTLRFLANPFDPAVNVQLFSRLVEPLLPPPGDEEADFDDVEAVLEGIAGWREEFPGLRFPTDQEVREAWPRLGPRARMFVATHDANHGIRRCAQDAAGEYELAAMMLRSPDYRADRLYGALALATLPLGAIHAPSAVLGALRGLLKEVR